MSDRAYFTVGEVGTAADYVIDELRDDPDWVIAMPIPNGISAMERALLFDHHEAVAKEVRRRGWTVRTHVRHLPDGTVLAIDLVDPQAAGS
jgi:hypothetical protein